MNPSVLVAIKRSKWERDIIHYGSEDAVKKIYILQNNGYERIHSSHIRQLQARDALKQALGNAEYIYREELTRVNFSDYDLVITLGGDNHFVHVSQFIKDTPVAGINSDPETSSGVLLHFTIDSFINQIKTGINLNNLEIDYWTGIEGELHFPDGQIVKTGRALSEISIRNSFAEHMSRYILSTDKITEEQKCSGLLLATGTGSTGWFSNCVPESEIKHCTFKKDADFFRFTARERSGGKKYKLHYGEIKKGETLQLMSEMDGMLCLDSDIRRVFNLPPGCRAILKVCEEKLPVVINIKQTAQ